ncbi:hypothetical protein PCASD_16327 [Puccinia coronata f. sp. avenae]|uniref:Uncharacterized protein n=1 Tax=Puccinia coronata f. sp. avenae TaxID=200324 RepID=A0A2N5TXQ5_9BASI|nr:hypothetical protein PCASD_16327 [Puccinia coronata f. sp. avenae]
MRKDWCRPGRVRLNTSGAPQRCRYKIRFVHDFHYSKVRFVTLATHNSNNNHLDPRPAGRNLLGSHAIAETAEHSYPDPPPSQALRCRNGLVYGCPRPTGPLLFFTELRDRDRDAYREPNAIAGHAIVLSRNAP